ncbi:glycogen synthase [Proteobacteria bacterium 005FR1]|nr:glycogen synthase [Proteobacteria bacterium 005FR1]
MHVLMVAAENDALPGGKVGGIGDVIRDLPPALANQGQDVSVITPGYGQLSRVAGAERIAVLSVPFAGSEETVELFRVPAPMPQSGVSNWVLEHDLFAAGGAGTIYCTRDREPFATDANKFALFCASVAECLYEGLLGAVDVLHCHDWHAAALLLLRESASRYDFLRQIPAAYTIHNLSIQGIRPLAHNRSSLQAWFPGLSPDHDLIADPRYSDCINLMRTGINLADRVHAVSPNYAREILVPSDHESHYIGGEHLELDLRNAYDGGRLVGILNGCDYSQTNSRPVGKGRLCQIIEASLEKWVDDRSSIPSAHFHALRRLATWQRKRKAEDLVLTSVGRLTEQKCRLFTEMLNGKTVLDGILERLGDGFFIMLGSGEAAYEEFFTRAMVAHPNFLFLQGYSDELSAALYSYGELFLMPSSFEPCGISQMLAMRAGTPCLVHSVGGLADTVSDNVDGFSFSGSGLQEQARNFVARFEAVKKLKKEKPPKWHEICRAASAARFSWDDTARAMLEQVYRADRIAMRSVASATV